MSICHEIALVPFILLSLAACADRAPADGENLATNDSEAAAHMDELSWIVNGELAAMPEPGRTRPLAADAELLKAAGVRIVISLSEDPPDLVGFADGSIKQVHIPVPDFTAPTLAQMIEFVEVVSASAGRGEPVAVHCTAGLGRSGTMAAVYLVARGATADEAIGRIRALRPGSIETAAQEEAVRSAEIHFSDSP